jgi:hypothetical protein
MNACLSVWGVTALELAASGRRPDRQPAGELIAGQVRAVAALPRGTGAAARTYLGDEIIKDMARRMLLEVAGERPGVGRMEPRGPFRRRRPSRGSPSRPWPRQCRRAGTDHPRLGCCAACSTWS